MLEASSAKLGAPPVERARVAGNYLILAAAEFFSKLVTFIAFTHLGRVLGAARYGSLEFTLAVMVFFTQVVDFGLPIFGAREVSRNRQLAPAYLREITRLRFRIAVVSVPVIMLLALLIHKPADTRQMLAVFGVSLLAFPLSLQWFFQAHDQMHWVAAASVVRWGVFAGLTLGFVRHETPLAVIGLVECTAVAAVAALCLAVLFTRFRLPASVTSPPGFQAGCLRESVPIGLSELTWAFLWYFATVLLGFTGAGKPVGWFGASHRVVTAMHTFVWIYFVNLLPSIARCVGSAQDELRKLLDQSLRISAWSGIFIAFVTTALAAELLTLVYGPDFAGGRPLLSVLAWILPVALLSGHYRYLLVAAGFQRQLLRATSLAALISILLCLVLIRSFGALGAAVALLAAVSAEFGLAFWFARRHVDAIPFLHNFARPLTALAASLACLMMLANWHHTVAVIAAAIVYLSLLVAWERKDLVGLYHLLASNRTAWARGD